MESPRPQSSRGCVSSVSRRCVVEAGFPYSCDCLPDFGILAEMLDKSPIKYTPQVHSLPPARVLPVHPEPRAPLTIVPHTPGEDAAVADVGPGGPACALQAGHRVLPSPQGPERACSVSAAGQPWWPMGRGAGEDPPASNIAAQPLQAPAVSQKHPRAVRGGGGVRQLHERCTLAAHAFGQVKPCLSPHELVGRCHI